MSDIRNSVEEIYNTELDVLINSETETIPEGWKMSPRSVLKFIIGGNVKGIEITPKYIGNKRLIEIAIATLLTDRALLLIGEPGTAKSWLSENLAAAIKGNSNLIVQGTAGTTEEQVKYSWNYALLIAEGPSQKSLIKTPIFTAMETGQIARFEEISRAVPEVQDSLISILSEKMISIPELGSIVKAKRGFSIIATANTRDKGVNEMSAALKRRFNIVLLPFPKDLDTEIEIVKRRVSELSTSLKIDSPVPNDQLIKKIVTIFREIRSGKTLDQNEKLQINSGGLSTAEAISLIINSMSLATSFGDGRVSTDDVAAGLQGAIVKDESKDNIVWAEYLENIIKKRGAEWKDLYESCLSFQEK